MHTFKLCKQIKMGAYRSQQTERALRMVREGKNPHAAAKAVGICHSTVYRAIAIDKKRRLDRGQEKRKK